MKKLLILSIAYVSLGVTVFAQTSATEFTSPQLIKQVDHTPVKNQAQTGTCWSFSTTSLVESQVMAGKLGQFDISEMFTVRNIYLEKAKNYILRQGAAQFGPGGLGSDVINAMAKFGAVPESAYSGLLLGKKEHNHERLDAELKTYLDSLLKIRPLPSGWMAKFQSILDEHLGQVPENFVYKEKVYTPQSFAKEVLKFKKDDYVFLTSFNHHPFYEKFALEIPDNWGSELYYNVPLGELIRLSERAIENNYSIMWDADVSNSNFKQRNGYAMQWKEKTVSMPIDPDAEEAPYSQEIRQQLFENLTTQDDHLMHIVGLERSAKGKKFFLVKNSWGEVGPFKGYIHVSEAYFAINTLTLVIPKSALDTDLKAKLGLK